MPARVLSPFPPHTGVLNRPCQRMSNICSNMRFAPHVFLPSSLVYLVYNVFSPLSFCQEGNMVFYLCVLMIMLLLGKIYGDRIVEVIDQPIVLFLLPCLFLTYLWSIRRGSMVKHVTNTAKPTKPKSKPPKESGLTSVAPSQQVKKNKKKKKMNFMKENLDPRATLSAPKMVPILSTFLELINHQLLPRTGLYHQFSEYILTPEQLARNDYPLEDPGRPGYILTRVKTYHPSPSQRICSRCGDIYHIENDLYRSDSSCFFHSESIAGLGRYRCCRKLRGQLGCKVTSSHVNPTLPLDDLPFKKTESSTQVQTGQLNRIYALDCEMVYTTIGFEVAKVSLVNEQGKPVYDSLVKPSHPVIDHNTDYSGICKADLAHVKVTLEDVQAFLLKHISGDTILVGHALQNDLKCLRIIHKTVVDTQVVFRNPSDNRRKKLKVLAKDILNQTIQDKKSGHCSLEDSRACMELMLKKVLDSLEVQLQQYKAQEESKLKVVKFSRPSPLPVILHAYPLPLYYPSPSPAAKPPVVRSVLCSKNHSPFTDTDPVDQVYYCWDCKFYHDRRSYLQYHAYGIHSL